MLLDSQKTTICALLLASALGNSGCGGGSSLPQPAGTTVAITFPGTAPAAVASQIGMGAWTAASLQSNQLILTVPQGETRYGVTYICPPDGSLTFEFVIYATTQDPAPSGSCIFSSTSTLGSKGGATGSVDASAVPGASSVLIYGLSGFGSVAGATGAFDIQMLQGTDDVAFVAVDGAQHILATKVLRSQTVPGAVNGGQMVVLAAGDLATNQTISVTDVPTGFFFDGPTALYETAKGTSFPVAVPGSQYAVIPASEAQGGDQYLFSASDLKLQHPSFGTQFASANLSVASASAVKLSLPAPLLYSPPTPAEFPVFDVVYAGFAGSPRVSYFVYLNWSPSARSLRAINTMATAAYQNLTNTLAIPDLTSLRGFLATPSSGSVVNWRVTLSAHTLQPGDSSETVINSGSYTEP
jgi:hypothetical protein